MRGNLESRAKWARALLVIVALLDVVAVVSDVAEYRLLGTDFTDDQANANDLRQGAIGVAQVALLIATAVFFIRWFQRAYDHVEVLGGERRFGGGWATGAWFVPILNLWRPKQIANDIWHAGEPRRADATLLGWWWAAFLSSNWLSQAAARLAFRGDTVGELRTSSVLYAIADSVDIAAAILAILVVGTVTRRLYARAEQVNAST
jgi:hypothetical protein